MNRQQVLQTATKVLGRANEINQTLYKGDIVINDHVAGAYFLDFNESLSLDSFNAFQEELVSDLYYELNKEQQGNIYLFFLRDNADANFKTAVEKNDRYARKYVFNESEFVDFFTEVRETKTADTSLIEDWKKTLDEAELSGVYANDSIASILRVLEAPVIKSKTTNVSKSQDPVRPIHHLRRIKLNDNFRPYPQKPRLFDFKKVNLITGANGTGKTSVMESIEVAICGITLRNKLAKEKDGCLEVMFDYSKEHEKVATSDNTLFKKRELTWYNVGQNKSNTLCQSFNRFNFFSADAAHRFSIAETAEDVQTALTNIVLGPEYEYILDRAEKLLKDLRPTYNRLDAARQDHVGKLDEANKFLGNYKEDQSLIQLGNELKSSILDLKLKTSVPEPKEDPIETGRILREVRSILEELGRLGVTSLTIHTERKADLERAEKSVASFYETLNGLTQKLAPLQESLTQVKETKRLLVSAAIFFSQPNFFLLEGIQQRLQTLRANISRIKSLSAELADLTLSSFEGEKNLSDTITSMNTGLESWKGLKKIQEDLLNNVLGKLDKLKGLVKQIHALGKSYLEENPQAENCPLCQTRFEQNKLLEVITKDIVEEKEGMQDLQPIYNELNRLSAQLTVTQASLASLKRLQTACSRAFPKEMIEHLSVTALVRMVEEELNKLTGYQNEENVEARLEQTAADENITEASYKDLKYRLSLIYPEKPFSINNKAFFVEEDRVVDAKIQELNEEVDRQTELRVAAGTKIKAALSLPLEEQLTKTKLDQLMQQRRDKLATETQLMNRLGEQIQLEETPFNLLSANLAIILGQLETYQKSQALQLEFQRMTAQLKAASTQLEVSSATYHRYKFAYDAIMGILSEAKNTDATKFLTTYLAEISDVFRSIHAPREFQGIDIDKKGIVWLLPTQGDKRSITQISTGQRSALALSIFLVMNRTLRKGPNIILFDDPISFVDDLNCLSFFDYLRLFVIKDRQVFFATANLRLANLFEKKFGFLEEDFGRWDLQRE